MSSKRPWSCPGAPSRPRSRGLGAARRNGPGCRSAGWGGGPGRRGRAAPCAGPLRVDQHREWLGVRPHHPVRGDGHGLVGEIAQSLRQQSGRGGLAGAGGSDHGQYPALLVGHPAGVQVEPLAGRGHQGGHRQLGGQRVVDARARCRGFRASPRRRSLSALGACRRASPLVGQSGSRFLVEDGQLDRPPMRRT